MAVPFLGYKSKSSYVRERARAGKTVRAIVAESGLQPAFVAQVLEYYELGGISIMRQAARKRGITVLQLKKQLMDVIIRDNMFDAILDDADEVVDRRAVSTKRVGLAPQKRLVGV